MNLNSVISVVIQAGGDWDRWGRISDGSGGSSFTVIFLGLLHAVPILFAAVKSSSKIVVILTSIAMGFVAVSFGGEKYIATDLGWVIGGCLLGIMIANSNNEPPIKW